MNPLDKSFGESRDFIARYALETFHPEDPVLAGIRVLAEQRGLPPIHVAPMDGLHLEVITRSIGARRAVEIGTLAGYSATCIARGLAEGGVLHTFELESEHQEVAREVLKRAGLDSRVRFHLGPAIEKLREIEAEGPFDLVFIDADKTSYPAYLEWAERNLRKGGVVLGDNTFGWGKITWEASRFKSEDERESIEALREFNRRLAQSGKFRATILPTGEGLSFGVKI